ncbi:MAG: hypothetical protein V3T17_19280 [Pseudomonadales bacterium]
MKNSVYPFLAGTLAVILIHLIVAYAYWDLNPANWDAFPRGFTGFVSIFVAFVVFGITTASLSDSKQDKLQTKDISADGWKDKLKVIKAFSEGKKLEFLAGNEWTMAEGHCGFNKPANCYRIVQ